MFLLLADILIDLKNWRQMTLLIAGFLIDFISLPVIAGFTSAAAITIATGQVKSLLGITVANGKNFNLKES
jgi:MFS superfamily sulfate permease-like transporter